MLILAFLLLAPPDCCESPKAATANAGAMAAHAKRRLEEASTAYGIALREAPPREPTVAERLLILRHAPALYTTPMEPFALKDAAAILHPNGRWIAYHLFWDDDIDFPDDNDPCDHEVVWVELSGDKTVALYSYFHGRILKSADVAAGLAVQWGKHGSMPYHWREWKDVESSNRASFEKLSKEGRPDSPLARGWPSRFAGRWNDFTDFTRRVDLTAPLRRNGMMKVSCLNNAVINRHFLRYNFAAKTEWPAAMCGR
jgi:hypothetical protein